MIDRTNESEWCSNKKIQDEELHTEVFAVGVYDINIFSLCQSKLNEQISG